MTEHARQEPDRPETDFPAMACCFGGDQTDWRHWMACCGPMDASGTDRWQRVHDPAWRCRGAVSRRTICADCDRCWRRSSAAARMSSEASIRCSTSGAPVSRSHRPIPPEPNPPTASIRSRPRLRQIGWRAPALIALVLLLAAGIGYWVGPKPPGHRCSTRPEPCRSRRGKRAAVARQHRHPSTFGAPCTAPSAGDSPDPDPGSIVGWSIVPVR